MLKALELIGFKSFADKTRFEFPPGITVIVGPNGSGKSNIVDAIKWVLGEQSAKSLRGKDMADVIFKGSPSGNRKVMNTAEATLVFDNSEGRLPVDAPEVYVTRRVYRSGEGEYLINRQPCRLKDIRDLFRGTGVGVDAYSLIEQGKVDRLLQASPKDRRAIFEEAAGISRFKAKKIEAQRRLERVEQNLLRLSDIVEEVDNRLQTVRRQATKAQRYREYSQRLQELRTQVGLTDWMHLSEKLAAIEEEASTWRDEKAQLTAEAETLQARLLEFETEVETITEELRRLQQQGAANREQIAGLQSSQEHHRARCHDLEDELQSFAGQLQAMTGRAGDLQQRMRENERALQEASERHEQLRTQVAQRQQAATAAADELRRLRAENDARRNDYVARMREFATLGNQVSSTASQIENLQQSLTRIVQRLEELEEVLVEHRDELQRERAVQQHLTAQVEDQAAEIRAVQEDLAERRRALARSQEELVAWQGQLNGMRHRESVLDELERRLEGLGAGVKQILSHPREAGGIWEEVYGLIANLLRVGVEMAPLVDAALGTAAQHIVVGPRWIEAIQNGQVKLAGRVGLLQIDLPDVELSNELGGRPGVIGRADQMVETDARYRSLVHRLLGSTWFVEKLADALALQPLAAPGTRFVTLAGELLDSDGTLELGPRHAALGLVSRRSELRALREEIRRVEQRATEEQQQGQRIREDIEGREAVLNELTAEHQTLAQKLADHRGHTLALEERHQQLAKQREVLEAEQSAAETQRVALAESLTAQRARLQELEAEVAQMERTIRGEDQRLEQLERERQKQATEITALQVESAKSEQRLEHLRTQRAQLEEHQRERSRAIEQTRAQIAQNRHRHREAERSILHASAELAQLYLTKESYARAASEHQQRREELARERVAVAEQIQKVQSRLRKLEEKLHQQELAAGEVRHNRQTLADRLRDDYGIEIAALEHEWQSVAPEQRQEIENEIGELRRKISNIGAVNMDALEELDELESRFGSLSDQYHDLIKGKEALERIIHKINADSRRLFLETLEAIRTNFQALYRKAFGGGKADLVLEENVDVLEAGVEILTSPPGKAQFSNSLLSGGEKALTAVALLLAIFQYRPSPFCVLDEVDAPFDEANIGRFIDVLKEFLGWTKFVIVTHSKKTMTAATTLYGVTMQESGVSKRVSVRFEDVSDDGHIRQAALDREEISESQGDEQAA